MRQSAIRVCDFWLGQGLCALLTAHRRLVDRFARRAPPPPRRILFLKLIEQGATVLAYSAVERAVQLVGRDEVYFCVFRENRFILDAMALVPAANVFAIDGKSARGFLRDTLRMLIAVRRRRIDVTIDLEFFTRAPAVLAYLCGAKRRVGLHRFTSEYPYRGDLMTHRVQYNPYLHTGVTYLLLVEALARDAAESPPLKIPAADFTAEAPAFAVAAAEQEAILRKVGGVLGRPPGRGPLILLNPNAGDLLPLRKWPADRFATLAARILAAYPEALIILTGTAAEQPAAADLCRQLASPRVVSLAGHTTLREALVLYTVADVLVTNDSGPAHFASMTPISTVVLFGPGIPQLFGPLNRKSRQLTAGLACSPCVGIMNHRHSPCTNNVCMQAITVERVFASVVDCLGERQAGLPNAAGGV